MRLVMTCDLILTQTGLAYLGQARKPSNIVWKCVISRLSARWQGQLPDDAVFVSYIFFPFQELINKMRVIPS